MDRLLLETDCPYMAPPPYRGQRCESPMIEEVAKVVAEIKNLIRRKCLTLQIETLAACSGSNMRKDKRTK